MSETIQRFDSSINWYSEDEINEEDKKNAIEGRKDGKVMYGIPRSTINANIPSAEQSNVDKSAGEGQRKKEIEEGKEAGLKASEEDYEYGGTRYGTEEAAAAVGKSKAGEDVWEYTAVGGKGELNKAALEKQKNIEELDKSDRDKLLLEDVKTARKLGKDGGSFYVREKQGITINGKPAYEIVVGEQGDIKNAQKLNNRSFSSEEEAKKYVDELQDAIYNDKNIRYFGDKYTKDDSEVKTKSGAIEDALKYRGIGYLNYLRKKGIINDAEYEKYKNQIQEVRDIRKPGIAKALNTAYLIYNAIANGFRNMGNLAFNVAGKGQVQYSQSALGNMLENAFEKAQEVNVAREKGAMEDVFDWQKSKRGLVLDSEKAFRDWGIKARENWSEWDRQTATNVISSFLLKDQKAFDEYMRRSAYSWDKTFAADFGKYLNKMSKKERQDFISGLFVQAADSPDGLIKMLTSLTTMPRQAAYKYYFENDAEYFDDVENAINNLEISEEDRQKLINEYEKAKSKQEEENLKQAIHDGWNALNKIIPANTDENAKFSKEIEAAKSEEEINRILNDAKKFAEKQKKAATQKK